MADNIADDLRKLMHAGATLGSALKDFDDAATSAMGKVSNVVDTVTSPDTIGKAIGVGIQATMGALGQELMAAAMRPPEEPAESAPPPAPPPVIRVQQQAPPPRRPAPPAKASPSSTAPINGQKMTTCEHGHGVQTWRGAIKCRNCRRVFKVNDASSPRNAPERCPCGSQLLPEPAGQRPQPYTGQPFCERCFIVACTPPNGGFAR
jgi:hypothetical protein